MPETGNISYFSANDTRRRENISVFSVNQETCNSNITRFNIFAKKICNRNVSVFSANAPTCRGNPAFFGINQETCAINVSALDLRAVTCSQNISIFSDLANRDSKNIAVFRKKFNKGWQVISRDINTGIETLLGFIKKDASPLELTDVALSDGTYEIYLKYSGAYWDDARDGKRLTVVINSGVVQSFGLPIIQNLRREIINYRPFLKWSVNNEYEPLPYNFGIWFSPTSPVSTTLPADYTVEHFSGQSSYIFPYTQTTNEYVAVAAITATSVGPAEEIYIEWDLVPLISPVNQSITTPEEG